jgi:uncharacterized membrane protein YccC
MFPLSTRTKEAIKTSLAMVIAYWIAMSMGWDKPYWAGFTVVTIGVLSAGVSLTRGITRSLGTLVGGLAGLAIIGLFPQERWWLMICVSLYVGFCTYMLTGKNQSYFWFLASFTCLIIIGVNSPPESQSAFQIAVLRTQETAMGALVYTLVAVFLWPRSSVGEFNKASCKLWATQTRLYDAYRDQMSGKGAAKDSRPLRLQEIQQQALVGLLLNAAETDSYEVWQVHHQWRRFHHQSTALMETLERWRQSFAEIQPLNLTRLLPNLDAVSAELNLRFEQIARMLADEAPTQTAQAITLAVDKAEMRSLTRFEEAAVIVTRAQLENLERLSRSLFDCVADIRGHTRQVAAPAADTTHRPGLSLDPDRFRAVVRVVVTLWIAFFLWVYVDPPGHSAYVMMAGIFALIIAMVPQASALLLFLSWGSGIAFAGVLYIFVMPHLSGFAELAVLIFAAVFVMSYLLGKPQQLVARMFTMASFLILIGIDNQQSYSFSQYANNVVWIMLSLSLAVSTAYIPNSPRPEKVFLRLLRRFFQNSEFLMARTALDWEQKKGLAGRWKTVHYRNDLLELPGKLGALEGKIDYRTFPDNTPEQVQALVTSMYALTNRIKDLVDARGFPQAAMVERHLLDDLRDWHQVIEGRFQRRGYDPTLVIEPAVDVRDRLAARLARLEERIDEKIAQADENELSTEDYRNLYRLLGSYRGLSEAAIGYAQLVDGMNWAQWQEARF